MMRLLKFVALLVVALVVLPPVYYAIIPPTPPPELPTDGKRRRLDTNEVVNVVTAGAGPPVLMVHGLPGSAYDWRHTTTEIANRGFQAIAYGRVGYGRSRPRRNGTFTLQANADDLIALIERLKLTDPTVVGWSYGGATAMLAAQQRPELFKRLVLVGTGGPDSDSAEVPEPPLLIRFIYSDAFMAYRSLVPAVGEGLIQAGTNAAFSGATPPDWWVPSLRANFARPETLETYRAEMFKIGDASFDPSKITTPTLLLHGDNDQLADVAISRYLVGVIPNARLVEYPGASHMLPVTHAAEITKEILAFRN